MLMELDKTGLVTATKTANEGRMHAVRMVQEIRDELSEPEKTLLAVAPLTRPSEKSTETQNRRTNDHS